MDLRELVPEVPATVKELSENSDDIYVVTLQVWLKLLGYKSGEVGGKYKPPFTDHVKDFKKEVMGMTNPSEKVDYTVWKKMDELLREKLPKDPYELNMPSFPIREDFETSMAYNYSLATGLIEIGYPIIINKISYQANLNSEGKLSLTNLPDGICSISLSDKIPQESVSIPETREDLAELELSFESSSGNPANGGVKITVEMVNEHTLKKAIRLFKAQAQGVTNFESDNRKDISDNIIDGSMNLSYKKYWDQVITTWGVFYGAPWIGIVSNYTQDNSMAPFWGTYETITSLYKLAQAFKNLNKDYVLTLSYISNAFGGAITGVEGISQIGTTFSIDLDELNGEERKVIIKMLSDHFPGNELRVPENYLT